MNTEPTGEVRLTAELGHMLPDADIQAMLAHFGWGELDIGEYTNRKQVAFARRVEGAVRERWATAIVAERDALRAFARGCLEDWPDVGMDGFDLQELATKTGLLEGVTVTEPCGENCNCIEYHGRDGFGDGVVCYRKTALLRGA